MGKIEHITSITAEINYKALANFSCLRIFYNFI